jgi:uncharacterized membrane protein
VFESAYRQRLGTDLAKWQRDGVITPAAGDAIRASLGPVPQGVSIPTVVAILGGLLIAAAVLTFVAANWTEIPRPARFVILLAGIAASYALAAWFDRFGRKYLSDLCVTIGSIVFGGAIALTGQMYHLSGDFAAAILLWAAGALLAAIFTGSRGALAVALVVACFWSGVRFDEFHEPHFSFVVFWLITAGIAVIWNAPSARHLVSLAALAWWIMAGLHYASFFRFEPFVITAAGGALLIGAGLMLANLGDQGLRRFGAILSNYGTLMFVVVVAMTIVGILGTRPQTIPTWVMTCGIAGIVLAIAGAVLGRNIGAAVVVIALVIGLALEAGLFGSMRAKDDPWLGYALVLIAMLSIVVSGMLDGLRPRVVAGWIGLATTLATITWAMEGSLLSRAVFLGLAGAVAVGLAVGLGRVNLKERVA